MKTSPGKIRILISSIIKMSVFLVAILSFAFRYRLALSEHEISFCIIAGFATGIAASVLSAPWQKTNRPDFLRYLPFLAELVCFMMLVSDLKSNADSFFVTHGDLGSLIVLSLFFAPCIVACALVNIPAGRKWDYLG